MLACVSACVVCFMIGSLFFRQLRWLLRHFVVCSRHAFSIFVFLHHVIYQSGVVINTTL